MNNFWIHPSLILIFGALLLPLVPARLKKGYLLLIPALVFARALTLSLGEFGQVQFLDWNLVFGRVDKLSRIFIHIMSLMCFIGTLYGVHVKEDSQHIAAWFYVAGSLGAILAGDFITLFLFWEVMAFSSVFLIWFRGRRESLAAGLRYLLVHVAGGLALLGGMVWHCKTTGSWSFNLLDVHHATPAIYLIMVGFLLNAAVPPLHAWLPDAYGEATFNGSVF
ncbi:MAG TPA: proton-conducting transporter membrane subunit, partial [Candidatus Sulfotelmatobacter sp.]|nr:proton-conducting transporter membrane subunit [Candidatus Sulfotelmatobacter sp.]